MRILFTAAIFVGSCLLFLIQPMAARIMLPAFGGTPAVWTASMVFFQATLLLGYLYAHLSNRKMGARQPLLHVGLILLAGLTLPFATRPQTGAHGQANPSFALIGQLALLVGPVFLLVSAGAPTLQRWFAHTNDRAAKDPYFLYSASNIGSMAALLAYPFLVEPMFDLRDQTRIWTFGYSILTLLLVPCAVIAWRSQRAAAPQVDEVAETGPDTPITPRQRLLWIALSAVPSSLLLGVTNYITSNIAPMPLLWVVPLALYLLTFIVAFASKRLVPTAILGRVMPLIVTPLAVVIVMGAIEPIEWIMGIHLLGFFIVAWMCHARLSDSRPGAHHLTEFYLYMSLGGVIGGIFNGLIAPQIFKDYFEYPLALVCAGMLRPPVAAGGSKPSKLDLGYAAGVAVVTVILFLVAGSMKIHGPVWTGMVIGVPAILAFIAVDRPIRYGLSVGAMFLVSSGLQVTADGKVVRMERSFFGVHKVVTLQDGRFHRLIHGSTMHGLQDWKHKDVPLTYYYPTGPIGRIMKRLPHERKLEVGLVGLGVGSIAAYGKPGEHFTYFEIDPDVEAIAKDERLFTFLKDSKAKVDVVLGDARLTLSERPDASLDVIALDAFSSDAIPIHLLTREAFQMYFRKLKPGGLIAVHISNRYLELAPVLAAVAKDLKVVAYELQDSALEEETKAGKQASDWVMLARQKSDVDVVIKGDAEWGTIDGRQGFRTWTDDYSNVLSVYEPNK